VACRSSFPTAQFAVPAFCLQRGKLLIPSSRTYSLHIIISIVRIPLELVGFTLRETAHVADAIVQFLFRTFRVYSYPLVLRN
jgi:hypothetical protein